MTSTVEVLRAAKARIDTPEKWCGDEPGGRGGDGQTCSVRAIGEVVGTGWCSYTAAREHPATYALARAMGTWDDVMVGGAVAHWNDTHTHAEVMAAFDRAIANEEARAQEFEVAPVFEVAR